MLLALLLFLVGFSVYNFRRLAEANDLNVHTYQVLLAVGDVEEQLYSIDSQARAYLVGGGGEALSSYRKERARFPQVLQVLQSLVQDNPKQQTKTDLATIDRQYQFWMRTLLEPAIAKRGTITDREQAIMAAGNSAGVRRRALGAVLRTLSDIEITENNSLRQRLEEQQRLRWWTQFALILGGVFSVILTASLVTVIARSSSRLDLANARLRVEKQRAEDANRQLLESNTALEGEIEQRRHAQEQLRENLVELRRSNSELEQFAYVASHDLQEPLRAVSGCVQILQRRYRGQIDERADQFILHAVEGSQRMQNLINDLLLYSRLGSNGKAFEIVDGERILAGALRSLTVALQETEAEITHDPLPTLRCDPGQIEQVLQNLISNAIKFRGENKPRIHVGCYREVARQGESQSEVEPKVDEALECDSWVISVADQGPGIEPQYFERIFVMFQRLHTRSDYPGTGIGLAICKKIVERHGGRIWVESPSGGGSTFYFSLPVAPKDKRPGGMARN